MQSIDKINKVDGTTLVGMVEMAFEGRSPHVEETTTDVQNFLNCLFRTQNVGTVTKVRNNSSLWAGRVVTTQMVQAALVNKDPGVIEHIMKEEAFPSGDKQAAEEALRHIVIPKDDIFRTNVHIFIKYLRDKKLSSYLYKSALLKGDTRLMSLLHEAGTDIKGLDTDVKAMMNGIDNNNLGCRGAIGSMTKDRLYLMNQMAPHLLKSTLGDQDVDSITRICDIGVDITDSNITEALVMFGMHKTAICYTYALSMLHVHDRVSMSEINVKMASSIRQAVGKMKMLFGSTSWPPGIARLFGRSHNLQCGVHDEITRLCARIRWRFIRAMVKKRSILYFWQEASLKRRYAPGGEGRMLDLLAFQEECKQLLC